jgi:predicted nucleotidyltransferase
MAQELPQIDASVLRRELFDVLRNLDTNGPVAIRRNGHVVAVLSTPTPSTAEGPTPKPHVDPRRLARLCKKHRIKRLSLFGSVVRDDFGPNSDVDVLYEREAGHRETLATFVESNAALADLFGRRVDFIERSLIENSKNQKRRQSILEDERVVYENGRAKLAGVLS